MNKNILNETLPEPIVVNIVLDGMMDMFLTILMKETFYE